MGKLQVVVEGGVYRHYKGNVYKVMGIARHTEMGGDLVVYRDVVNDEKLWARPLGMFLDRVREKDTGSWVGRFEYLYGGDK